MIIAVDFDGTCVTNSYPSIGRDIGAQDVLRDLVTHGHQLILLTMRDGEPLAHAVKWFADNNLPLLAVNANPSQATWTSSRKVFAHLYIDDAAVGVPLVYSADERPYVDWKAIRPLLHDFFNLTLQVRHEPFIH